jgi:hypothetical protein
VSARDRTASKSSGFELICMTPETADSEKLSPLSITLDELFHLWHNLDRGVGR